jgi:hypothetical protein
MSDEERTYGYGDGYDDGYRGRPARVNGFPQSDYEDAYNKGYQEGLEDAAEEAEV